jgi:hypothetical protein
VADDGEPAGRRGDGAVVHTDDLPAWLGGHIGGVETAREIARQALALRLSQAAHHVGLRRDVADGRGLCELARNQPSAARGNGIVDLGCKSPR